MGERRPHFYGDFNTKQIQAAMGGKNYNHDYTMIHWLVVSTPLKHVKVNWDDENPNSNGTKNSSSHHQLDDFLMRVHKADPKNEATNLSFFSVC